MPLLRATTGTVLAAGLLTVPSAAAAPAPGSCTYKPAGTASKKVDLPTTDVRGLQPYTATLNLNSGAVSFDALTRDAPCTANAFQSLAAQHYFDGTPCHRLTTGGIFVLQCGDPSGTGTGGPGYRYPDENLSDVTVAGGTYPAGTVAMANAGPGTNGSQFFLVYKDSPLPPNYTPFGRITSGLGVLDKIAETGVAGGGQDGKPRNEVVLRTVRISPGRAQN
ncbi:peptidylprolyl isomerase [Streptomyces sp. NBC_01351]|uniref:peptidylprolyl isomerase n=1 Tax=Streptomyces sp. NBC_01351 TaxID=2903833 RepID=UPI002E34318C|nr:peptidylprolyl isomerase [Streptomyces sp. NBC_01351]